MPKRLVWWLSIFLFCAGIIYYRQSMGSVVRWLSSCSAYPFLKTYHVFGSYVNGYKAWLVSKKSLCNKIAYLEKERSEFLDELIEYKALSFYQGEIKELDAFRKKYTKYRNNPVVQVLMVHQSNDEHYLLLEGGLNIGVKPDTLAIYKNHLVGRVVEVFSWYSKVRLITDKRMHIACYCSRTKAKGIHTGTNQFESHLKFVDHLQRVRRDDLVVSSGKGLIYPRGLGLGKVVRFVKRDVDYEIVVNPSIDLASLEYCLLSSDS